MSTYRIAATNSSRALPEGEPEVYDDEPAALDMARDLSTKYAGISFGVFEVRPGEGAFLIASFLNGKRRFTARAAGILASGEPGEGKR